MYIEIPRVIFPDYLAGMTSVKDIELEEQVLDIVAYPQTVLGAQKRIKQWTYHSYTWGYGVLTRDQHLRPYAIGDDEYIVPGFTMINVLADQLACEIPSFNWRGTAEENIRHWLAYNKHFQPEFWDSSRKGEVWKHWSLDA